MLQREAQSSNLTAWRKRIAVIVTALAVTAGATACAVEVSPPKRSCSPEYRAPSKYGSFSAQQSGPGASIQWGIYPNYPATRYVADVYVGSTRFDHKDQNYPPHGSVPSRVVRGKGGQDFTVSGVIYDGHGNRLNYRLACVIA